MLKIHWFLLIPTTVVPVWAPITSTLHCYNSILAGIQTHGSYLSNLFLTRWQIKHCFHQLLAPTTYWTRSKIPILTFIALYKITPGASSHLQSFNLPTFLWTHLMFCFSYLKCLAYKTDLILYAFLLSTSSNTMVQVKSQLILQIFLKLFSCQWLLLQWIGFSL